MRRQPGQVRACDGTGQPAATGPGATGQCPQCGRNFGWLVAPDTKIPRHFVPRRTP